jgi:hypothetical protein
VRCSDGPVIRSNAHLEVVGAAALATRAVQ